MRNHRILQAILLFAVILSAGSCKKSTISPKPPKPADDPQKENVTFTFSAADSKYASLRETVSVTADNPGKAVVTVDWGDGAKDSDNGTAFSHKYTAAGKYKVKAGANGGNEEWDVEISSLLALDEAVKELYKTPKRVWVMTHRAHTTDRSVPENSIAAVRASIQAGADVIETDTHRTKDGKVVISHDESIDNHTDGKGKITNMTLEAIQRYHLTDRGGSVTQEVMPTLEEFLMATRGKIYVNLDYSPRTASTREVLDVVEKLGMLQQVFLYCKDASFVKEVFRSNPEANAYVRSEDYTALLDGGKQYFLQVGWNSGQTKSSECVIRCGTAYKAGVLCSVNLLHVNHDYIPEYSIDEGQLNSLFNLYPECQMISTDCPQEMVAILKRKGYNQ
ncbi:MAG: glycerophosphodiester phosphodiesterase [Bacteroidales bacterium]|nr:glycerophosphodiester phosphodiesterase [Bacteroidales bacterium]